MKFHALSIFIGILIGLLLSMLVRKVSTFSDVPEFPVDMTVDQASTFYDNKVKEMHTKFDAEMNAARSSNDLEKEMDVRSRSRHALTDLADAYNNWLMNKQKENPEMKIFRPKSAMPIPSMGGSPMSPAPQMMETPMSPAPQMMETPMSPAVSTFEPEPYY